MLPACSTAPCSLTCFEIPFLSCDLYSSFQSRFYTFPSPAFWVYCLLTFLLTPFLVLVAPRSISLLSVLTLVFRETYFTCTIHDFFYLSKSHLLLDFHTLPHTEVSLGLYTDNRHNGHPACKQRAPCKET